MVESGSDDLLQLPASKEVYSYDWKGQNGRQYDLSKRFFDDKKVTFSGYFITNTKAEFWQKYLAFWNLLKSPGVRTIFANELEQTFSCFYLESSNTKRFTKLRDFPDKIAVKVDLTLQVMFSEMTQPGADPIPPLVNAGIDKSITLPTNQVQITDAIVTAQGGATISSTVWDVLSTSPAGLTATLSSGINPTVSGLSAGQYTLRLRATDNNGLTAQDTMTINVAPSLPTGFPFTFPFNLS